MTLATDAAALVAEYENGNATSGFIADYGLWIESAVVILRQVAASGIVRFDAQPVTDVEALRIPDLTPAEGDAFLAALADGNLEGNYDDA